MANSENPLGLSDRGLVYDNLHEKASELVDAGTREESKDICRLLLSHADLGDWHKAGCHLIFGMGKDDDLAYAE